MLRELSAEELLEGAAATHRVEVPAALLAGGADEGVGGTVLLRPLSLGAVQTVSRAAKGDGPLTSLLMIQQALVDPALTADQVAALPAGLVRFLLARVNAVSGLSVDEDELEAAVRTPVARACFVLAREFGWTAAECSEMTVGQILMYLEMLGQEGHAPAAELAGGGVA